jgi:putative ATPase
MWDRFGFAHEFHPEAGMSDFFDIIKQKRVEAARPLAARMRPQTLAEFVGQNHILAPEKLLRRMIETDQLVSLLFFGPPGTGKTTLAQLIATTTQRRFVQLNAASVGVKEVRDVLTEARAELESTGTRTVLFLDEIHRFNRTQQDILLTDVENGLIVLIGATTQNPYFAVNAPLISRSQIFQFEPLATEDIRELLQRAIKDPVRGFGAMSIHVADEALEHWIRICDGDARRALMALELAVNSQRLKSTPGKTIEIDLATACESIQAKALVYDPTGDEHYDSASALIKSMRGSDPDAAVYWLARMLCSGEDPRFVARRIAICAAEDIGNADPTALLVAAAAVQMTEFLGMPECRIILSQAAIYLACCPKSNSAIIAIDAAMADVKENRTVPVPRHLRDANYRGAAELGHTGYQYAHNYPEGYVPQVYLGVEKQYYFPTDRGHEAVFKDFLDKLSRLCAEDQNARKDHTASAPSV